MQRSDRPALQQQPVAADQVSEVEANIISYGARSEADRGAEVIKKTERGETRKEI